MDAWSMWRARLGELRQAIDDHLCAAEAIAAGPDHAAYPPGATTDAPGAATRSALNQHADVDAPYSAGPSRWVVRGRRRAASAEPSAAVRRALDHAAEHFNQPLSLEELARIAGCSREHLARACRRETGVTVHAHLVRLRLTRAAREVRAGDKIEAVMLGVGYRGKRNFYRQFKARFGMTPGRYRESTAERHAADDLG